MIKGSGYLTFLQVFVQTFIKLQQGQAAALIFFIAQSKIFSPQIIFDIRASVAEPIFEVNNLWIFSVESRDGVQAVLL